MSGIYKLTAPNGKCYIGQSIELKRRMSRYRAKACKQQRHLYNALKKHGWKNFTVEFLWRTKHPERYSNLNVLLDILEIAYIKHFDSIAKGYNLQSGGSNGRQSEETKQLLREANLGKTQSKETKLKISLSHRKPIDQYTLEGEFVKRWGSTAEATMKISGTTSGTISTAIGDGDRARTSGGFQWRRAEGKPLSSIPGIKHSIKSKRPVVQYSLAGDRLKTWGSVAEAAKALELKRNSIDRVCQKERKSTGGFQWRFKEQAAPKLEKVLLNKGVIQINKNGEIEREWTNATEASRGSKVARGNINSVCNGNRLTAGGFKWKYAEQ